MAFLSRGAAGVSGLSALEDCLPFLEAREGSREVSQGEQRLLVVPLLSVLVSLLPKELPDQALGWTGSCLSTAWDPVI